MKAFLLLLAFTIPAHASIFGADDRTQAAGETARATALQVPLNYATTNASSLNLDFAPLSDNNTYGFCSDEAFASEKVSPIACTGFLIGPDLLVTAGHCAVNWTRVENTVTPQCEDFGWLFDYQVKDGQQPATSGLPAQNLVKCKSVVYANFVISADPKTGKITFGEDIALIRLERKVTDRKPLTLASGTPGIGEKITQIGYPLGLPAKTNSAKVLSYGQDYFRTDLDVAGGNSGGPVLNSQGKVSGVLVRSFPDADYYDDERAGCRRWNSCSLETGKCKSGEEKMYTVGSEAQRIQALLSHIPSN